MLAASPAAPPWVVWLVLLPLGGALLSFLVPRASRPAAGLCALGIPVLALATAIRVIRQGPFSYRIGEWGVPLGIGWEVDGFSALLLLLTAVVGSFCTLYSFGYYPPARNREPFWPLWMFAWTALDALFLSADVFNLYVTLELLGLAAVALVARGRSVAAVAAAIRYLVVNLLASLSYLLGVSFLYAQYATLDLETLSHAIRADGTTGAAAALITVGLLLKAAAFPLHFWLPSAHGEAPAPVSALLSALVVKAPFYLLLRFWVGVFPAIAPTLVGQALGVLGTGAILWGSLQALLQERLKLLVAYSTVAQLGYLLLVFPLALGGAEAGGAASAWAGGTYIALSHGLAKAAMFLAAGTLMRGGGHQRIADLGGVLRGRPASAFAFSAAAVSLAGLPPSGGFVGKWLLFQSALESGQWWWAVPLILGGLLTAGYSLRVVGRAFREVDLEPLGPVSWVMPTTALSLSLVAVVLGLAASSVLGLLAAGSPFSLPASVVGLR